MAVEWLIAASMVTGLQAIGLDSKKWLFGTECLAGLAFGE